jgi:hypothetical protein
MKATETKIIPVVIHNMGLGFQCESTEVEGVFGAGSTKLLAVISFIERYLERFDEVVEVSIKE